MRFFVHRAGTEDCIEHTRDLGKGVLAVMLGGLIGTIIMSEFQNAWSKVSNTLTRERNEKRGGDERQQHEKQQENEDATMKAAGKVAEMIGHPLSHEQKKKLGPVVHYSFGIPQGGVYGAVAEFSEGHGFIAGMTFGAALFVTADEIVVPALGLSPKPRESSISSHLYGLAAHLVYGVTTEVVRRGLRAAPSMRARGEESRGLAVSL
jgi:uncharacterized membrane protein YagU involved in acid resistance